MSALITRSGSIGSNPQQGQGLHGTIVQRSRGVNRAKFPEIASGCRLNVIARAESARHSSLAVAQSNTSLQIGQAFLEEQSAGIQGADCTVPVFACSMVRARRIGVVPWLSW